MGSRGSRLWDGLRLRIFAKECPRITFCGRGGRKWDWAKGRELRWLQSPFEALELELSQEGLSKCLLLLRQYWRVWPKSADNALSQLGQLTLPWTGILTVLQSVHPRRFRVRMASGWNLTAASSPLGILSSPLGILSTPQLSWSWCFLSWSGLLFPGHYLDHPHCVLLTKSWRSYSQWPRSGIPKPFCGILIQEMLAWSSQAGWYVHTSSYSSPFFCVCLQPHSWASTQRKTWSERIYAPQCSLQHCLQYLRHRSNLDVHWQRNE